MHIKSRVLSALALSLLFIAFVSGSAQSTCTFAISPTSESAYSNTFTVTPTPSSCSYTMFGYYGPNITPYTSLASPATGTQTFTYTNTDPTGSSQFFVAVGAFASPCLSYYCAFTGQLAFLPFSIFPAGASSLQVLTTSIPNTVVGTIYPSFQLQATGGTPPYTWNCRNCDGTAYQLAGPLAVSSNGLVTSLSSYGYDGGLFTNSATLYSLLITVTDAAGNVEGVIVPYESLPASSRCANYGGDTDGDGLCDEWELHGYTAADGTFVDLPDMGANPMHKDIFVQTDYMVCSQTDGDAEGCSAPYPRHTHKPDLAAMARATEAFANAPIANPDGKTGITLHVDCGSDCIMNPVTGQHWLGFSQAIALPHKKDIGQGVLSTFTWTSDFDAFKAADFSAARQQTFHYMIFAHELAGMESRSGVSRVDTNSTDTSASDSIISLGAWLYQIGSPDQQAGTFMHELGHNLSFQHGGNEPTNFKPNYLSVMNYLFQMGGLIVNRADEVLDYSRFLLPSLNEAALNETVGLNGVTAISAYGTRYYCPGETPAFQQNGQSNDQTVYIANGLIDWNCDETYETNVAANIDAGGTTENPYTETTLPSYDDWANIVFTGGSIGAFGAGYKPPATTSVDEITPSIDATIVRPFEVGVASALGVTEASAGTSLTLTFTITNIGTQADIYTVNPSSSVSWADLNGVPSSVSLASGESTQITLLVTIPPVTTVGEKGNFVIAATSQSNPREMAEGTTEITVNATSSITAATPAFSLTSGSFTAPQTVSISDATVGATIYYTTDGTPPSASSAVYSSPLTVGMTETIQAIAVASGYTQSPVASATYTINIPVVATPTFIPAAGSFTAPQMVTITEPTVGAAVYYTINGATPTANSTLYSGPITVSSTETIQAIATASGYSNSPVASAAYTINLAQDFSLSLSSSAITVTAGESGSLTASIAPINGFGQAVTFSCSGLPSGAACSFAPATVTPNGTASGTTTVTVTTSATAGLLVGNRPYELAGLLAGLSLLFAGRRFRRLGRMGVLLLFIIGVGAAVSCGGSPAAKTTPTISTVSVNATSGSLTHTASLSLTVQ